MNPSETSAAHPTAAELFDWTPELLAQLPVVRGLHAPAYVAPPDWLSAPFEWQLQTPEAAQPARLQRWAQALGRPWKPWDAAQRETALPAEALRPGDAALWEEAIAQLALLQARSPGYSDHAWRYGLPLSALLSLALRWHGPRFALQRLQPFFELDGQLFELQHAWWELRRWLAACDVDALQQAQEVLAALDPSPAQRQLRAYLFAHRADWVEAALADPQPDNELRPLRDCCMAIHKALAYTPPRLLAHARHRDALLLQLRLHGLDALHLLGRALREGERPVDRLALLELLARCPHPQALPWLLKARQRLKAVNELLERWAERDPETTLRASAKQWLDDEGHSTLDEQLIAWAPRAAAAWQELLRQHPELHPLNVRLLSQQAPDAQEHELPALLREPPWLLKRKPAAVPTRALPPCAPAPQWCWQPGEREALARPPATLDLAGLRLLLGADPLGQALEALLAGRPVAAAALAELEGSLSVETLLAWPDEAALALWNGLPPACWASWPEQGSGLQALLARHQQAALPGLYVFLKERSAEALPACAALADPALLPPLLAALRSGRKRGREALQQWLHRHVERVAGGALPLALGPAGSARLDAQFALRWLAAQGLRAALEAQAAALGATRELAALLDADPLLAYPAKLPELPEFFKPERLLRPRLHGGARLTEPALRHLGTMLAFSTLEAPYAGLAEVRAACEPDSLRQFLWELYTAWAHADAPPKGAWALRALGLLGDDTLAAELARKVWEWPSEGLNGRALTGLELLAAIGSEAALTELQRIALKAKNKSQQARAQELVSVVARARGLDAEELGDRLAPSLGLDEAGALELDYGARRLRVLLDEQLRPLLRDAQGLPLKDLPAAGPGDDAERVAEATARLKRLKKELKPAAHTQIMRLERAMLTRRRWSAAEFRRFFLAHALLRHLSQRLLWAQYDEAGRLCQAFRVAEDCSLADAADRPHALAEGLHIGIAHPLDLPAELATAFGQQFADYEIRQPFEQLGRETHGLQPAEAQAGNLQRYAARRLAPQGLLGLVKRDWHCGATDGGRFDALCKPLGAGLEAWLTISPGVDLARPASSGAQQIQDFSLLRRGASAPPPWAALDPLTLSELLRDVERLPAAKKA